MFEGSFKLWIILVMTCCLPRFRFVDVVVIKLSRAAKHTHTFNLLGVDKAVQLSAPHVSSARHLHGPVHPSVVQAEKHAAH